MGIWKQIKYTLNSSLGTAVHTPLNELFLSYQPEVLEYLKSRGLFVEQFITSSTIWTKPANMFSNKIEVYAIAAGGNGGKGGNGGTKPFYRPGTPNAERNCGNGGAGGGGGVGQYVVNPIYTFSNTLNITVGPGNTIVSGSDISLFLAKGGNGENGENGYDAMDVQDNSLLAKGGNGGKNGYSPNYGDTTYALGGNGGDTYLDSMPGNGGSPGGNGGYSFGLTPTYRGVTQGWGGFGRYDGKRDCLSSNQTICSMINNYGYGGAGGAGGTGQRNQGYFGNPLTQAEIEGKLGGLGAQGVVILKYYLKPPEWM